MSILSLLMQLVECLDFSNADAFETLCDPILRWMFDEQHILQRLKSSPSELQLSELETLWDIVTNTLPEDKISLQACYLRIPQETYEYAGIKIPE